MKTYSTIAEIKANNNQIGHRFFDRSSMRFFNSKVLPNVYRGVYFITSERFRAEDAPLYTVRICLDGKIETVGEFNKLPTAAAAKAIIKSLPNELPNAIFSAIQAFNKGTMDEFIKHATTEQVHNGGTYSMESFTGACAWLFENCEKLDFTPCKLWLNSYKEALATYNA